MKELAVHAQGSDAADVFYGVVDRRSFELTYCSMGSILAVQRIHKSGEIQPLPSGSEPIRESGNHKVVQQNVPLNPRDQLLFCTPGVLEARDAQGEQFGPERLYKAILSCSPRGVHELRNEILYKVQEFSGIKEPERDQTVVALEVKDRVIKLAKTTSE